MKTQISKYQLFTDYDEHPSLFGLGRIYVPQELIESKNRADTEYLTYICQVGKNTIQINDNLAAA